MSASHALETRTGLVGAIMSEKNLEKMRESPSVKPRTPPVTWSARRVPSWQCTQTRKGPQGEAGFGTFRPGNLDDFGCVPLFYGLDSGGIDLSLGSNPVSYRNEMH